MAQTDELQSYLLRYLLRRTNKQVRGQDLIFTQDKDIIKYLDTAPTRCSKARTSIYECESHISNTCYHALQLGFALRL